MKLQQFKEIVAIAEHGSIRAAARQLRIAQPALTRSLAELERELGAPLFERRARGVLMTTIGKAVVLRATSLMQDVRRMCEEAEQLRGLTTGAVRVGLSIAAHLALLPATLRPFRSRYPETRMHIIEGFYPTLESGLRDGSVDFYVGPEPWGPLSPELSQEALFSNSRKVLCRAGHPLAKATSLAELGEADWATTSITVEAEDEMGVLFKRHGLPPPNLVLRSQSALTLITCLANSELLAMAPVQWGEFSLIKGALTVIPVKEELSAPAIVIIRRADLPLTPAATHLLDLMRRVRSRRGRALDAVPVK
jgi:LysR family transcriptional regulator of abg operon